MIRDQPEGVLRASMRIDVEDDRPRLHQMCQYPAAQPQRQSAKPIGDFFGDELGVPVELAHHILKTSRQTSVDCRIPCGGGPPGTLIERSRGDRSPSQRGMTDMTGISSRAERLSEENDGAG
jgi:hypothetical protein